MCTPRFCSSTPNSTLIGKRGSVQEPPKCQNLPQNNCSFWPPEADTMNTFRWKFACKCRPWVCSSTPNLALIGKTGSVQLESPKYQKLSKIMVFGYRKPTQWIHSDEIWPVNIDLGSALAHQIWPWSVKEGRYRSPETSKFAQNCFWPPEAEAMNAFRWNFAGRCRPWVCNSTPNLALIAVIDKRGLYRSPQNVKICQNCGFWATWSRHNEYIQMKFCG